MRKTRHTMNLLGRAWIFEVTIKHPCLTLLMTPCIIAIEDKCCFLRNEVRKAKLEGQIC